ncbi:MAG TPA: helix-turn-helix domain-containing protein, partial [Leptospiraceae bacterium]|nr:helix-turn-helix domain-containing protein [Leptospiraceae bacterium]
MSKRVGQILKDTREEKRLTVRDIVKETNIPLKYVLALENEDYGQFPAETYTVGFLKTYADFLKLDTGHIINLFRGEQLEDANIPLQELTKPTMKMMAVEVRRNKAILPLILVLIVGIGVFAFSQFYEPEQENSNPSGAGENENRYLQGVPSDISFINQSVHDSERVPFTLTPEQGFTFSVNNQLCKIFIKGVRKNEDNENIAIIGFNLFPDKKVYTFETKVNENSVLSSKNPELSNLRREIKILTQAITEKSAKILVS